VRLISALWYGYGTTSWWLNAGQLVGVSVMVTGIWFYSARIAHLEQRPWNGSARRARQVLMLARSRSDHTEYVGLRRGVGDGSAADGKGLHFDERSGVQEGDHDEDRALDLPQSA
jgi:hypothetical protein